MADNKEYKQYFSSFILENKVKLIILTLILFSAANLVYIMNQPLSPGFGPPTPEEWPELTAEYNKSVEELTITVENSAFRKEHGQINISSTNGSEITLSNGRKTINSTIWAQPSFLGLNLGNKGLTNFPIEPGESVTIKGIKNGDTVKITYSKYSGSKSSPRIMISGDKAYVLN
jgi:hypothetical protein